MLPDNIDEQVKNLHKVIGKNVKRIREEKGFSQKALSLDIGQESTSIISQAEFSETSSNKKNDKDFSSDLKINNIDITISLEGDYLAFKKFVSIIFKTSRLIEIKNLSFGPSSGEGTTNSLVFELDLSCKYYLVEEVEEDIQMITI